MHTKCCENCRHCFIDYSVDYYDCQIADAMESSEFDRAWDSNGRNCERFDAINEPDSPELEDYLASLEFDCE